MERQEISEIEAIAALEPVDVFLGVNVRCHRCGARTFARSSDTRTDGDLEDVSYHAPDCTAVGRPVGTKSAVTVTVLEWFYAPGGDYAPVGPFAERSEATDHARAEAAKRKRRSRRKMGLRDERLPHNPSSYPAAMSALDVARTLYDEAVERAARFELELRNSRYTLEFLLDFLTCGTIEHTRAHDAIAKIQDTIRGLR